MDVWEGKHIVWIQLLQTLQPAATSGNKWNYLIFYQRFVSTKVSKTLHCYDFFYIETSII